MVVPGLLDWMRSSVFQTDGAGSIPVTRSSFMPGQFSSAFQSQDLYSKLLLTAWTPVELACCHQINRYVAAAFSARQPLPLVDVVAIGEFWPALQITLTSQHQPCPNTNGHQLNAVIPYSAQGLKLHLGPRCKRALLISKKNFGAIDISHSC